MSLRKGQPVSFRGQLGVVEAVDLTPGMVDVRYNDLVKRHRSDEVFPMARQNRGRPERRVRRNAGEGKVLGELEDRLSVYREEAKDISSSLKKKESLFKEALGKLSKEAGWQYLSYPDQIEAFKQLAEPLSTRKKRMTVALKGLRGNKRKEEEQKWQATIAALESKAEALAPLLRDAGLAAEQFAAAQAVMVTQTEGEEKRRSEPAPLPTVPSTKVASKEKGPKAYKGPPVKRKAQETGFQGKFTPIQAQLSREGASWFTLPDPPRFVEALEGTGAYVDQLCGNPIDGTLYILAISGQRKYVPTTVTSEIWKKVTEAWQQENGEETPDTTETFFVPYLRSYNYDNVTIHGKEKRGEFGPGTRKIVIPFTEEEVDEIKGRHYAEGADAIERRSVKKKSSWIAPWTRTHKGKVSDRISAMVKEPLTRQPAPSNAHFYEVEPGKYVYFVLGRQTSQNLNKLWEELSPPWAPGSKKSRDPFFSWRGFNRLLSAKAADPFQEPPVCVTRDQTEVLDEVKKMSRQISSMLSALKWLKSASDKGMSMAEASYGERSLQRAGDEVLKTMAHFGSWLQTLLLIETRVPVKDRQSVPILALYNMIKKADLLVLLKLMLPPQPIPFAIPSSGKERGDLRLQAVPFAFKDNGIEAQLGLLIERYAEKKKVSRELAAAALISFRLYKNGLIKPDQVEITTKVIGADLKEKGFYSLREIASSKSDTQLADRAETAGALYYIYQSMGGAQSIDRLEIALNVLQSTRKRSGFLEPDPKGHRWKSALIDIRAKEKLERIEGGRVAPPRRKEMTAEGTVGLWGLKEREEELVREVSSYSRERLPDWKQRHEELEWISQGLEEELSKEEKSKHPSMEKIESLRRALGEAKNDIRASWEKKKRIEEGPQDLQQKLGGVRSEISRIDLETASPYRPGERERRKRERLIALRERVSDRIGGERGISLSSLGKGVRFFFTYNPILFEMTRTLWRSGKPWQPNESSDQLLRDIDLMGRYGSALRLLYEQSLSSEDLESAVLSLRDRVGIEDFLGRLGQKWQEVQHLQQMGQNLQQMDQNPVSALVEIASTLEAEYPDAAVLEAGVGGDSVLAREEIRDGQEVLRGFAHDIKTTGTVNSEAWSFVSDPPSYLSALRREAFGALARQKGKESALQHLNVGGGSKKYPRASGVAALEDLDDAAKKLSFLISKRLSQIGDPSRIESKPDRLPPKYRV